MLISIVPAGSLPWHGTTGSSARQEANRSLVFGFFSLVVRRLTANTGNPVACGGAAGPRARKPLDKTLVIQDNDKPLAVLLKYEHFLAMQEEDIEKRGTVKTSVRRNAPTLPPSRYQSQGILSVFWAGTKSIAANTER